MPDEERVKDDGGSAVGSADCRSRVAGWLDVFGSSRDRWALPIVGVLALVAVGWYLLVHLFGVRRIFRRAGHFLDVGDAELPPEERVKHVGGFKHGSGGG